jgi:hypothetical protein
VTITRTSDGAHIAPTGNVLVADDNVLSGTGKIISATANQSFSGVVASFSDSDLVTPASDLVATVDWGDGTAVTTGTVSGSSGSFTVSGTHTYTLAGTDTVTVTLSDDAPGTATATATSTANIAIGTITIPASEFNVTENVSNTAIIATSGNHMIFIGGSGDAVTAIGGAEQIQAYQGGNTINTGAGNDTIRFSGSNNVINAGAGTNAVVDSAGSNNTIVLPGAGGSDIIYGYVLTNGDKLDLRPMLATTGWTGDLASIGNYIKLATSVDAVGGHAQILLDPSGAAGGATYSVATLYASASLSLDTLLAHAIP